MFDARLGGWLVLGILLMAAQGPCSPICPEGAVATQAGLCMVELRPSRGWRILQNGDVSVRLAEKANTDSRGLYGFWLVEMPEELRAESGVQAQLGGWKLVIRRDGEQKLLGQMMLRWRLPYGARRVSRQETVAVVARWISGNQRRSKQIFGQYDQQAGILQIKLDKWAPDMHQVELIPVRRDKRAGREVASL
ncbi:MAG: hypothetical protein H6728_14665 [Myxococcales bacterium]|nr:hypothetical protein [Myxococcales bacterium]MCB9644312.1 hypothetical protein [Myxococcales bacterium]